ncbi:MAG: hypothetical protein ACJAZP_000196 [Psychromonas sp.]
MFGVDVDVDVDVAQNQLCEYQYKIATINQAIEFWIHFSTTFVKN